MQNVITFHTGVAEEPEKKDHLFVGGRRYSLTVEVWRTFWHA
jgi:hypothetical protein